MHFFKNVWIEKRITSAFHFEEDASYYEILFKMKFIQILLKRVDHLTDT